MSVRRAEALAAVALVVGARQEPVVALRRLAAEDRDLRVLGRVAAWLEQGVALDQALVRARLLRRAEARAIAGQPPEVLAAELGRLAQTQATPVPGEHLARWLPLWAFAAATVPSLAIGASVVLIGGAGYDGIFAALGIGAPRHAPRSEWLAQLGVAVAAAIAVGLCWVVLRHVPLLRLATVPSLAAERARRGEALLQATRAGRATDRAWRRWERWSGDRRGVRRALDTAGGDHTAALVALGLLPRDADGRADWDRALAELRQARTLEMARITPLLATVVVAAGICGLVQWGSVWTRSLEPLWVLSLGDGSDARAMLPSALLPIVNGVLLAAAAVLGAHLLRLAWLVLDVVAGPARDWPIVADRVARALERREDLEPVLRGLALVTTATTRRRLRRALHDGDGHPGYRLVAAGLVPGAHATAMASADVADLPTLLRAAAWRPATMPAPAASAMMLALLLLPLLLLQVDLATRVSRMLDLHGRTTGHGLSHAATASVGALMLGVVLAALAGRCGWWSWVDGSRRLASGLIARRLLATGASDRVLADAIRRSNPRVPDLLETAAEAGDTRGVLAAAGWPIADPRRLDDAIETYLTARTRCHLRWTVAGRVLLPLLFAVPLTLNALAVFTSMTAIPAGLRARIPDSGYAGNSLVGLVITRWWSDWCEAQGRAVVERVRAAQGQRR